MVEEGDGIYMMDWTLFIELFRVALLESGLYSYSLLYVAFWREISLSRFMGTKYLNVALPGLYSCDQTTVQSKPEWQ